MSACIEKNRKTQFSVNFPFLYKLRHNETEITNSSNQGAITGSLLWWCLFFPVLKRYRTVTAGAQVLWNNLPLKYEPLLYLTTRQQSSNCFTWTKTTVTVNAESAFFGGILNTKVKKNHVFLKVRSRKWRYKCANGNAKNTRPPPKKIKIIIHKKTHIPKKKSTEVPHHKAQKPRLFSSSRLAAPLYYKVCTYGEQAAREKVSDRL